MPEVKTLCRKLAQLVFRKGSHRLGREVAQQRIAKRGHVLGFFYLDGHVRAYHGKHTISNAYVTRMHLAAPATTDSRVNDHDFRSDSIGVAIPYGIYDLLAIRGSVFLGVSHDTSAFAAHSIADWWKREGSLRYRRARQLLILADTGGSNSCRRHAWKTELQAQLSNPFDLTPTVAHYPTGTSKWNPLEHRLFSEFSKNWAAEPLDRYQKMLNFLRTTTTKTGLAVSAYLDRAHYPTDLDADPVLSCSLRLPPHKTLPAHAPASGG
jgi:hypothetical protein